MNRGHEWRFVILLHVHSYSLRINGRKKKKKMRTKQQYQHQQQYTLQSLVIYWVIIDKELVVAVLSHSVTPDHFEFVNIVPLI